MARATKSLGVWMNGDRVATWAVGSRGHELHYDPSWVTSSLGRPISLSLPFLPGDVAHRGEVVRTYFENLLPDRPEVRNRIRDRFRAASAQGFDLLAEVGRDCVGALQILADDGAVPDVRAIHSDPLSDKELAEILRASAGLSFHGIGREDFRLSLAGAQEKTAFLWHDESWHRPRGATPSTHIFKLPLGEIGGLATPAVDSVANEWLCLRLAAELGLPVAKTEMGRFEGQDVLIVERFDRRRAPDGSWWLRLPVEDLCQAHGVSPEKKYEADGGPGINAVLKLLQGSESRTKDRELFLRSQIVFWLLAAPDGHAKNFSLFLGRQGTYRLAPLYDILSAYPWMGTKGSLIPPQKLKLAMAVEGKNRHYEWARIQKDHWAETARRAGLLDQFEPVVEDLLDLVPRAIATIESQLPSDFSGRVAETIFQGLRQTANKLGAT